MLDVPMYFLYRDGHYQDVAGKSFRDFIAANLRAMRDRRLSWATGQII